MKCKIRYICVYKLTSMFKNMRIFNLLMFICLPVFVTCANIELKEEMPPVVKAKANLGVMTIDKYGNSVDKINERTELVRLVASDTVDIAEVTWLLKSNNLAKPMKLIYDKRSRILKKLCTKTNEVREFKNVGSLGLCDFFYSGRKSIEKEGLEEYCQRRYSFESAPIGSKPEQDPITGNVKMVCDYVNNMTNDTTSVKYLEWTAVTPVALDWYVRAKFTYINASGVKTIKNIGFFIRDDKMHRTIEIK